MPVGVENFGKFIDPKYYFVDKTEFIRRLIDKHSEVTLFTRPRRFGKTLTMSMLDWFFSIQKEEQSRDLFQNLKIGQDGDKYMQYRGQSPVLFFTLKNFSVRTWEDMAGTWRNFLQRLFLDHKYLADTSRIDAPLVASFQEILQRKASVASMADALALLMNMMHQYYGKQVILLIDEYDAPIQQAWSEDFYEDCIVFMRQFLSSALKSNPDLDFAILTGVLRVAKESIFSGLNNLDVYTVMDDDYADVFGFTSAEVEQMAKNLQKEDTLPALKRWYDGYHFGKQEIYNPWSVINFFDRNQLMDYWVNTSGNSIIKYMLQNVDADKEANLLALLRGESISVTVHEGIIYDDIDADEDALYTMLLTTGYLTSVSKEYDMGDWSVEAIIPNREVQDVFRKEIVNRFRAKLSVTRMKQMLKALLNGKAEEFTERLSVYIRSLVSAYDAANKESFYHGFLLGMTALLIPEYVVESNRESGYGRFDLAIFPKDMHKAGVILEFKSAESESKLPSKAEEALMQIDNRQYDTEFAKRGITTIWKYGIAFYQKQICVKLRKS